MSPTTTCATEPTTAERIRSVLARAESLTIAADGHRHDLVGRHTVDDKGQLRLRLPAGSPLSADAACTPSDSPAVLLEFTDIAPTTVRDRVRSRVTLSGWLTPTGPEGDEGSIRVHRVDVARAALETGADILAVSLDELALAEPDPLAREEAALLTHLADAHQDAVAQLTRLAGPRLLQGVIRVQPLALDRYGITLRCEYARSHCDARFLFSTPVGETAEVNDQIQLLLAAARACPHRRRAFSRS